MLLFSTAFAQKVPLGTWTAHIPMQNATSVCESKNYVYAACQNGVIGVNVDNDYLEKYTKVSGLAEVFTSEVGYDTTTSTLVITYQNSNIDLINNGKITNLPYLKNAAITGDKKIYSVFCTNGKAYLGLGYGLMVLDLVKKEISETYTFNNGISTIRVNSVFADDNQIFCATSYGILRGRIADNVNLLNFNNWTQYSTGIPQDNATAITQYNNKIFAAIDNTIYQFDGTDWTVFFSEANWKTMHLNNSYGQLLISQHKIIGGNLSDVRIGRWNGTAFDFYTTQFFIGYPLQILQDKNGSLWHADLYRGLIHQEGSGFAAKAPNAPFSLASREMAFMNGTIWSSSSGVRNGWAPSGQESKYIYACTDYYWTNYTQYTNPVLNNVNDIAVVQPLPAENKILFGAANGFGSGGIIEFSASDNTMIAPDGMQNFRISSADLDASGNAWLTNAYSSSSPLICRKSDGTYTYFNSSYLAGALVKSILVDDNNQIWIGKESGDGGIVVLNYGNDIDDKSDDQYFLLAAGRGLGNLPSNNVISMAKDKDGVLWLGTSRGIAIVSCSGYVTDYACEAEQICIDRNDGSGFCDNLLEDEIINCITVDAANRKWIGTFNGLFQVSADGEKTLHYFNETNSPLLSNNVRSVTINPQNGDLFIGTEKGICSYRADATVTDETTEKPFVYPNPVAHDYSGPIAIKGIPNDCNVKIMDISGNLVFQTTALGGQAIWDGNLVNGSRAATGVYVALCVGSDKKEKVKLKFVLIH
ncbi:MAG: two-component regulator propeller domain-containing protein [Chitinophagales bacterium]